MKLQRIKRPKMVEGMINARLRDEEDDMIDSMPPKKDKGMSEDKKPSKEEIMESHFAEGGQVEDPMDKKSKEDGDCTSRPDAGWGAVICRADGGEVMPEDEEEEHYDSIASAIMAKRKKMAEGGRVDIDMNEEEQPNSFYKLNEHAALKENYDSDMDDVSQPMDSNEDSDDIESDKHDMISMIRRKMKSRMK